MCPYENDDAMLIRDCEDETNSRCYIQISNYNGENPNDIIRYVFEDSKCMGWYIP